jgi:uncharacterized protein related to proFAR isomerase
VEDEFLVTDLDRVAGIGAALETDHKIRFLCQKIHNFGFSLVPPLGSNYNSIRHFCS